MALGRAYSACSSIGKLFPATLYRARRGCGIDSYAFNVFANAVTLCGNCRNALEITKGLNSVLIYPLMQATITVGVVVFS